MRVLQVHNFYQFAGGEDVVVSNEKALLESYGHEVFQYTRSNHDIEGIKNKLEVLFTTHYSEKSKKDFTKILKEINPGIVHVHNFFPLITPSVFDACLEAQVPSVFTLHNYRLIHPNGYLINNKGGIDERSVKGSAYLCVPGKVYRNSVLQTAVVAHMIEYHRKAKTWHSKVNQFIALTAFAKSKFIEGGLPPDKIVIKPNFINDYLQEQGMSAINSKDNYFVMVGRLSGEKGVEMLVKTWLEKKIKTPVYIVGEGPLQENLSAIIAGCDNVKLLGRKTHGDTLRLIHQAKALIFPSMWYEGFPMTIVEAFSLGTPVITSNIGSQAEIVTDQYNGLHFRVGDMQNLADTVAKLEDKDLLERLMVQARQSYLENYNRELNYKRLIEIYQEARNDCYIAKKA